MQTKVTTSRRFTVNFRDLSRGLITAVIGAVNTYSFKGSVTLFNDGVHWVITY